MKNHSKNKQFSKVRKAIEKSWCRCTSYWPLAWFEDNPAYGQCAVTALVFQDYFGGEIFVCKIGRSRHYFNVLDYGEDPICIDFTEVQYYDTLLEEHIEEARDKAKSISRKQLLHHKPTAQRYEILALKVEQLLKGK